MQVHGPHLDMMSVENANSIGVSLSDLLEVDNSDNMKRSQKSFMRIHVLIKLH